MRVHLRAFYYCAPANGVFRCGFAAAPNRFWNCSLDDKSSLYVILIWESRILALQNQIHSKKVRQFTLKCLSENNSGISLRCWAVCQINSPTQNKSMKPMFLSMPLYLKYSFSFEVILTKWLTLLLFYTILLKIDNRYCTELKCHFYYCSVRTFLV